MFAVTYVWRSYFVGHLKQHQTYKRILNNKLTYYGSFSLAYVFYRKIVKSEAKATYHKARA